MATFLLTWNPAKWDWTDLPAQVEALDRGEVVKREWTTGQRTRVDIGDSFFFLRQGVEPRGIMGSGISLTNVYKRVHWDRERAARNDQANMIELRLETLVNPDENPDSVLRIDHIDSPFLADVCLNPQASGTEVPTAAARHLKRLWWRHLGRIDGEPDDAESGHLNVYLEGLKRSVVLSRYERNPRARAACIERWGAKCSVCDFDFFQVYGERGMGFIEVHHLKPIAESENRHEVDPVEDLRPVCSNCHAMIHREEPLLSIQELKQMIHRQ